MIVVKLLDKYQHYSAGEYAGFPDKRAKDLIKAGKAVAYKEVPRAGAKADAAPVRERPDPTNRQINTEASPKAPAADVGKDVGKETKVSDTAKKEG